MKIRIVLLLIALCPIMTASAHNGLKKVSDEEINIGVSVRKGNTVLMDAINSYLSDKTAEDFNALMEEAIKIQPLSE